MAPQPLSICNEMEDEALKNKGSEPGCIDSESGHGALPMPSPRAELAIRLHGLLTGGRRDREVDRALHDFAFPPRVDPDVVLPENFGKPPPGFGRIDPEYTRSLDDAVMFVEQVLPGWSWEMRRSGFGDPSQACVWNPMKTPGTDYRTTSTNPARALCASALAACFDGGEGEAVS